MTVGVGGIKRQDALNQLGDMTAGTNPILKPEFQARIQRLQQSLQASGAKAMYLHAGTNLFYFTGLRWSPSERMVAAVVPADGELFYIAPNFELDTLRDYWMLEAPIVGWHEHESPYESFHSAMLKHGISGGTVLVDEASPFYTVTGLCKANPEFQFELGQSVTQALRSIKSDAEVAIIQRAHEMTLAVLQSAASILEPGITTTEVEAFIDEAHRAVGASAGSYFCIVLFGVATSFPHGVKDPQVLKAGDWVLMDTGCVLHEYISDITRSFCFGEPTENQRIAWSAEKRAQLAAFHAAGIGVPCEEADSAARQSLVESGYGPDYELPGLPHRTGHGCGLDIHEGPNLVRGEGTTMSKGMVFSNEPMLVVPDQFGVRLEDHFYLTEDGPQWFTQPSKSIDDPFGS